MLNENRLVVLDTETTGLSKEDRVVSFGAVVLDGFEEIESVEYYFNPLRTVHPTAEAVHGLSNKFLAQFETFNAAKVQATIQDSPLVIHNAAFDLEVLNREFAFQGLGKITNQIIDTLELSRRKFPGSPASLDALCSRFKIFKQHRKVHGALVDAMLLSKVYQRMRDLEAAPLEFGQQKSCALPGDFSFAAVEVTREEAAANAVLRSSL